MSFTQNMQAETNRQVRRRRGPLPPPVLVERIASGMQELQPPDFPPIELLAETDNAELLRNWNKPVHTDNRKEV